MNINHEAILIVDDEKLIRRLLVTALSGEGFTCFEAGNAEEALKQFQNHQLSVVLLDIMMPGRSGIELLKEVMVVTPDIAPIIDFLCL